MYQDPTADIATYRNALSNAAIALAALDQIDYGVMLLDAARRVALANDAARVVLGRSFPFVVRAGQLCTAERAGEAQLDRLLAAARRGERRIETFGSGTQRVGVAATPLTTASPQPASKPLMLTIGRQAACESITLRVFARATRLTEAETVVLEKLASGLSPTMIAESNRIKPSTVRTHIRNLLSKTGSSGLRDLTSQLATLPPVRPILSGDW